MREKPTVRWAGSPARGGWPFRARFAGSCRKGLRSQPCILFGPRRTCVENPKKALSPPNGWPDRGQASDHPSRDV